MCALTAGAAYRRPLNWLRYTARSDRKTPEAVEGTIPQSVLLRANEPRR